MMWLAGGDPYLIEKYKKMPLIEYYTILDARIAQIKKEQKDVGK